ncbi:MAG: Phosphoribosylformylglycinamidine synthase subunit PurS [Myxococcota bacterium]|nr:Phosphoribosylformylglycinamidine synthase subunit PurS [Myxococcota bacterium]
MKAKVYVTLKNGVLDPQGKAVEHALHSLGFSEAGEVRLGKFIEVQLSGTDRAAAAERVRQMCEQLLANTIIENYRYEIE